MSEEKPQRLKTKSVSKKLSRFKKVSILVVCFAAI